MVANSMLLASSKETSFAFLPVLTLLISNVLNCKVIRVGPLPMAGGLIMFPLAALFGDVVTEVYGYASMGFSGRVPPRELVLVAFSGWAIMVFWEIAALPLTLPLVRALKQPRGRGLFRCRNQFQPVSPVTRGAIAKRCSFHFWNDELQFA
jgi:hypothetical protein